MGVRDVRGGRGRDERGADLLSDGYCVRYRGGYVLLQGLGSLTPP